jgi:hypothetical protein
VTIWRGGSTILITMAGAGQRFRDAGYTVPKFAITIHGHTLFWWSLHSLSRFLGPDVRVVFVGRAADRLDAFLAAECPALGITDYRLVELEAPTDGQATSALRGLSAVIDPQAPLLIYNIDTFVEPDSLSPDAMIGDGWIPCFHGLGDHWSFVRLDESGTAIEVREKVRVSPHATIGLYAFASASLYAQLYDAYYGDGQPDAGERYIAPMYNQLIRDGHSVRITDVPISTVHPLGTPAEVERFARE